MWLGKNPGTVLGPLTCWVWGNEIADQLTKDGSVQKFVRPELSLGASTQNIKKKTKCWVFNQHLAMWHGPSSTQRHAWKLNLVPSPAIKTIILCVNRTESRFVAGLLTGHTWLDNEVRELITVKVLRTSLLNTTVVAFKVLSLGSYAPMPAPNPPFKTVLELVLWNDLQNCHCITPVVISVIKMSSFKYFLYLWEQKKVVGD